MIPYCGSYEPSALPSHDEMDPLAEDGEGSVEDGAPDDSALPADLPDSILTRCCSACSLPP